MLTLIIVVGTAICMVYGIVYFRDRLEITRYNAERKLVNHKEGEEVDYSEKYRFQSGADVKGSYNELLHKAIDDGEVDADELRAARKEDSNWHFALTCVLVGIIALGYLTNWPMIMWLGIVGCAVHVITKIAVLINNYRLSQKLLRKLLAVK